jgi:hypothetical protein
MERVDFATYHEPALETDEVRHNLILGILARVRTEKPPDFLHWTLGEAGQCAVKTAGRSIVIGELDEAQCRKLAELTAEVEYPGVVGPDLTAKWFVDRAIELGLQFIDPIPQQIHALSDHPRYPGAPGYARQVTLDDAPLFVVWISAFLREAVPHDPVPTREQLERVAGEARYLHLFWVDGGRPVSMAGIVRRTRNSAAIAGVYTPPMLRGRGYGGSVTAAVVERVFAEGK